MLVDVWALVGLPNSKEVITSKPGGRWWWRCNNIFCILFTGNDEQHCRNANDTCQG